LLVLFPLITMHHHHHPRTTQQNAPSTTAAVVATTSIPSVTPMLTSTSNSLLVASKSLPPRNGLSSTIMNSTTTTTSSLFEELNLGRSASANGNFSHSGNNNNSTNSLTPSSSQPSYHHAAAATTITTNGTSYILSNNKTLINDDLKPLTALSRTVSTGGGNPSTTITTSTTNETLKSRTSSLDRMRKSNFNTQQQQPNNDLARSTTNYHPNPSNNIPISRRLSRGESLVNNSNNSNIFNGTTTTSLTNTTTSTTTLSSTNNQSSSIMSTSPMEPLRHSASMLLLNRTTETLKSGQPLKKLSNGDSNTANTVFELRRLSSNNNSSNTNTNNNFVTNTTLPTPLTTRQQSLIALFKLATESEDSSQKDVLNKSGLSSQELIVRERAAYVLDRICGGWSGVPPTALMQHEELHGTVHEFVKNDGSAEDNPGLMSKVLPESIQRIGILDIRIFNLDRHGGNILIKKRTTTPTNSTRSSSHVDEMSSSMFLIGGEGDGGGGGGEDDYSNNNTNEQIELTPIDHGLSLPSWTHLGEAWFDWMYTPQANAPLTSNTLKHISELDCERDAQALRELGIRESCIATNTISTLTLKELCIHCPNLSLKDLASIWQRPYSSGHRLHDQLPSPLERFIEEALLRLGLLRETFISSASPPPPQDFFTHLVDVVREEAKSGHWRSYVV
jgi:hypothetical protein